MISSMHSVSFGNRKQPSKGTVGVIGQGIISQGQTLPPTQVTVVGKLGMIRKDQSTANLSRDVWIITDEKNGQTYSLFVKDGTSKSLDEAFARLAQHGHGARMEISGIAHKPVAAQRYPFLMMDNLLPAK